MQEKRCTKRLALTKQAGSWIPRLERMVQSRKLCDFEKNVLLTLIGSVIQPNKVHVVYRFSSVARIFDRGVLVQAQAEYERGLDQMPSSCN